MGPEGPEALYGLPSAALRAAPCTPRAAPRAGRGSSTTSLQTSSGTGMSSCHHSGELRPEVSATWSGRSSKARCGLGRRKCVEAGSRPELLTWLG
eukprot:scaffold15315_cov32-Phaeocystis_antarctica.AAC.1